MNTSKNNKSIFNLKFLGFLIIITAIPVFFWAWRQYHPHAKLLLKDASYEMPWGVLYLNLYWISQIILGALLIYFGNLYQKNFNFMTE